MDCTAQLAKDLREMDHALRQQVLSHELSELTVLKLQAERKYKEKASKMLARYSKRHDFLDYFNSKRLPLFLLFAFISLMSFIGLGVWSGLGLGAWFMPFCFLAIGLSIIGTLFLVLAAIIQPIIELRMPGQLMHLFDISEEGNENLSHEEKLERLARVEVLGGLIGIDYERMKFEINRNMEKKMETTPEKVLEGMGLR